MAGTEPATWFSALGSSGHTVFLPNAVESKPPVKFFLPDWDDRVDPGYDFESDRFSLVRDPYRDDVYAHELAELTGEQLYDGLLISRMALQSAGPKRELVDRVGMRAYLRLPKKYELLGDCGAFGYLREPRPLFDTEDVIDYYERLGFDYGVSVDHAIVPEFEDQQEFRFRLTLDNARDFLKLHGRQVRRFVPVGACQGWDPGSYIEAARELVNIGYDYIAVGGLARSNTRTVAATITAVMAVVPPGVRVHVFGVARLTLLSLFIELGIESVDSAAPLRQAWLSANDNYFTLDRTYAAIRLPLSADERPKRWTLVGRSDVSLSRLQRAEREAMRALRAYAKRRAGIRATLDAIRAYDDLLAERQEGQTAERRMALYEATLRDKPWKHCPCGICKALGVEVIIFRGNNRNRRRGFHNLWVVRQRIERARRQVHGESPAVRSNGRVIGSTYPLEVALP